MVVRSWSELDFDNVCSNAKVFGFDLDNTLASSKQLMKPAMIERFCALLDHTVVALISGGGMAVVTSQVLDVLTPNARRGNLHVMPTSGSRYYRWDGTQWALMYAHDLSEATVAAVSESLERHARELDCGNSSMGASNREQGQPDHLLRSWAVRARSGQAGMGSR